MGATKNPVRNAVPDGASGWVADIRSRFNSACQPSPSPAVALPMPPTNAGTSFTVTSRGDDRDPYWWRRRRKHGLACGVKVFFMAKAVQARLPIHGPPTNSNFLVRGTKASLIGAFAEQEKEPGVSVAAERKRLTWPKLRSAISRSILDHSTRRHTGCCASS
jgi:hypothetical protein